MVLIISRNSACAVRKYVVAELLVGKIYQLKEKKYMKGLLLLTYLNWMTSILAKKCRVIHKHECEKHNRVAEGISPSAPTTPCMRDRTGRFPEIFKVCLLYTSP